MGFISLTVFGWLVTLMAAGLLMGNNQPKYLNPLTYWRNINDELYWLKHFNHLPGIRQEVAQEISGLSARFIGDWIVTLFFFLPFAVVTVIAYKAIVRRRYSALGYRLVLYSIAAAILMVLGTPQY